MTPLIVFANDLAKYFVLAANKKKAATHIIYEITSRMDANYNRLSDADKKLIINVIEDFICGNLQFMLNPGEMVVRKQKDVDEFLAVKKYIIDHLLIKNDNE